MLTQIEKEYLKDKYELGQKLEKLERARIDNTYSVKLIPPSEELKKYQEELSWNTQFAIEFYADSRDDGEYLASSPEEAVRILNDADEDFDSEEDIQWNEYWSHGDAEMEGLGTVRIGNLKLKNPSFEAEEKLAEINDERLNESYVELSTRALRRALEEWMPKCSQEFLKTDYRNIKRKQAEELFEKHFGSGVNSLVKEIVRFSYDD